MKYSYFFYSLGAKLFLIVYFLLFSNPANAISVEFLPSVPVTVLNRLDNIKVIPETPYTFLPWRRPPERRKPDKTRYSNPITQRGIIERIWKDFQMVQEENNDPETQKHLLSFLEEHDLLLQILSMIFHRHGRIYKKNRTSENTESDIYIIELNGQSRALTSLEVSALLTAMYYFSLAKVLPDLFGPGLPAGGGDEPGSWNAQRRSVPWSVLRQLAALAREHEENELEKKIEKLIRQLPPKLKKDVKSKLPAEPVEAGGGNSEEETVAQAPDGEPPDPGGGVKFVWRKDRKPATSGDLLGFLLSGGYHVYPEGRESDILAVYAYRPDGDRYQLIDQLKDTLGQRVWQGALVNCQTCTDEPAKRVWTELRFRPKNELIHLRLLAELMDSSVIVFSVSNEGAFVYELFDGEHRGSGLSGFVTNGVPSADYYFVKMPDGWQRLKSDSSAPFEASSVEVDPHPAHTQVPFNPYLDENKTPLATWTPVSHQDLLDRYRTHSPDMSDDSITHLIRRTYSETSEADDEAYYNKVILSMVEAGLVSAAHNDPSSEVTLSKTLLGFIEHFWMYCSDFFISEESSFISDTAVHPEREQELRTFLLKARDRRENRFLGSIPASEFKPWFVHIPLPTIDRLIRERNELFRILARVLDQQQAKTTITQAVVYGGAALRGHLVRKVYQGRLDRAVKRELPAFNDIDLLVSSENTAVRLMELFKQQVMKAYPHLRIHDPGVIPIKVEGLATWKMKVWFGNVRLFTLDVSHSSSKMLASRPGVDYLPLPLSVEEGNPNPLLRCIGLESLLERLTDEAMNLTGEVTGVRVDKAIRNLRIFMDNDPALKEDRWVNAGQPLFEVMNIPPLADGNTSPDLPRSAVTSLVVRGTTALSTLKETREEPVSRAAKKKKSSKNKRGKAPKKANSTEKREVTPNNEHEEVEHISSLSEPAPPSPDAQLLSTTVSEKDDVAQSSLTENHPLSVPAPSPEDNIAPASQSTKEKKPKKAKNKQAQKAGKEHQGDDIDAAIAELDAKEKRQAQARQKKAHSKPRPESKPKFSPIPDEELAEAKAELSRRIQEWQAAAVNSQPQTLTRISQLFDGHHREEEIMARLAHPENIYDSNWVIDSLPIQQQNELWLFEALRRSGIAINNRRLLLEGQEFIVDQAGQAFLELSLAMGNPVAAYLFGTSSVKGVKNDGFYLKQAAIKFHPARLQLCQQTSRSDSDRYDPKALVSVYKLASKHKQVALDVGWQKRPELEYDQRALTIDFALEKLMTADDSGKERRKAAALLLTLSEASSPADTGILDIMVKAGLEEYFSPSLQELSQIRTSDRKSGSELERAINEIARFSGRKMLRNYNLFSKAQENRNNNGHSFENFLYSGAMLDPQVWRKLHDAFLLPWGRASIEREGETYIRNIAFLRSSLCYVAPHEIKEIACNREYYRKTDKLFGNQQKRPEVDDSKVFPAGHWFFNHIVTVLSGLHYRYQKGESLESLKRWKKELTEISNIVAPMTVIKKNYFLQEIAGLDTTGFELSSLELSGEELLFFDSPVCGYPDNPKFSRILLHSLLALAKADLRPHAQGGGYFEIPPSSIMKSAPLSGMLKHAIAMGNSEACWIRMCCEPKHFQPDQLHWLFLAARQMPFVRRALLGKLLSYENAIFNPKLVPVLYRTLARYSEPEVPRMYGCVPDPPLIDQRIEWLDGVLVKWASIADADLQKQTLQALNSMESKALKFLIQFGMGMIDVRDQQYQDQIQKIAKSSRVAELYFELTINPDQVEKVYSALEKRRREEQFCNEQLMRGSVSGRYIVQLDPGCYHTVLQKIATISPEIKAERFQSMLKLSAEAFEKELICWLYSLEYFADEGRSAGLATYWAGKKDEFGRRAFYLLAQWNPEYLVESFECHVRQCNKTFSQSLWAGFLMFSNKLSSEEEALSYARNNTQKLYHVVKLFVAAASRKKEFSPVLRRTYLLVLKELLKADTVKGARMFGLGKTYQEAEKLIASMDFAEGASELLPYTPEWIVKYEDLTKQSNASMDDQYSLVEQGNLWRQLDAVKHPVLGHLQFRRLVTAGNQESSDDFFNTVYPAMALSMEALSWYSQHYQKLDSITYLERLRSFYMALRSRTTEGMLEGRKFFSQSPELEKLLSEMYKATDMYSWFMSLPGRFSESIQKAGLMLAVLSALEAHNKHIEEGEDEQISADLAQLIGMLQYIESHAREFPSYFPVFISLSLLPDSGGEFMADTSESLANKGLIRAAQLASAAKENRPGLAKKLIEIMDEQRVNDRKLGQLLAWSPFIFRHYGLVHELAAVLETLQRPIASMALYENVLNWSWQQDSTAYDQLLRDMVEFALRHHSTVDGSFLREILDRYCGFLSHKADSEEALTVLKARIMSLFPESEYQTYIDRINEYLSYISRT